MIGLTLSLVAIGGLAVAGFGVFIIAQAVSRNEPARTGVLVTVAGLVVAIVFFIIGAGLVD
jgi:hypothetical protein